MKKQKKILKKNSRIASFARSKVKIIIFVLVFAIIGLLFLWQGFAATTPPLARLEAERMNFPTDKAVIVSDADASAGQAVRFKTAGTMTSTVNLPSNATSVSIRAKGVKCYGDWPKIGLFIDGKTVIAPRYVSTTSWTNYTAHLPFSAGDHQIKVEFQHSKNASSCVRYLYVDKTSFYGDTTVINVPAPTIALSATPSSISTGQSSTLTWSSTNATSCVATGAWSGTKTTSGSISTGALSANSTYELTCTGGGGSTKATSTINVNSVVTTPQTPTTTTCNYPAQVLNLSNWKQTLPTGSAGSPTEILQPQLATYTNDPFFKANTDCSGVVFRAPTNGVTTSGSSYPRSELREMTSNGTAKASWSTESGSHAMEWDAAITAVPSGKKHVVVGQIHDANDDVITIRLEYPKLFIDHGGNSGAILTNNYALGTKFSVKWVVSGGKILTYYNGNLVETYTKSGSGMYFKAGMYTQSNCSTESSSGFSCGSGNYGEAIIHRLIITHN